jgi:hypothetical protein
MARNQLVQLGIQMKNRRSGDEGRPDGVFSIPAAKSRWFYSDLTGELYTYADCMVAL